MKRLGWLLLALAACGPTVSTPDAGAGGKAAPPCLGCVKPDGSCVFADEVKACGVNGNPCAVCPQPACQDALCVHGSCVSVPLPDGNACDGGVCANGSCEVSP